MLGTRQLARVLDHVTAAGGKLVLVGDHRQLPELEAGGTFRALVRRPGANRLAENRRQVAGWERDALDHLREGRASPIELDRRFLLRRTERGDQPLAHGYAVTGHVAQGMTVDRTFVLAGSGISREWAYAALSRGRNENRLYAVGRADHGRDEFAPVERPEHQLDARDQLARDLARSDAQPLALDRVAQGRGIEP